VKGVVAPHATWDWSKHQLECARSSGVVHVAGSSTARRSVGDPVRSSVAWFAHSVELPLQVARGRREALQCGISERCTYVAAGKFYGNRPEYVTSFVFGIGSEGHPG